MCSRIVLSALAAAVALAISAAEAYAQQQVTAKLKARPDDYEGPGPVQIEFLGAISVTRPAKVKYKFVRSDGAQAPIRDLVFNRPGTKPVSTTWTLGGPGFDYSGWQAIEVLQPQSVTSNKAKFTVHCQPASLPDLVVTKVFLENGYKRAEVKNVGEAAASGVYVRFYVDGIPPASSARSTWQLAKWSKPLPTSCR